MSRFDFLRSIPMPSRLPRGTWPRQVWAAPIEVNYDQDGTPGNPFGLGTQDVSGELTKLLWCYRHVTLHPGRYACEGFIIPPSESTLRGSGPSLTTLVKTAGPWAPIQSEQNGANNVVIEGLSIDCGKVTFAGIGLFGSGNTVRDVDVSGHISPTRDGIRQESFAILLTNPWGPNGPMPARGNRVAGCTVRDFAGDYNGGIVIAGGAPCEGVIEDCRFFGSRAANETVLGCMGASVVQRCQWYDTAVGVYTEGGLDDMIVRDCTMRGVRNAALLVNLVNPQRRVIFERNNVGLVGGAVVRTAVGSHQLAELFVRDNHAEGLGALCSLYGVPNVQIHRNTGYMAGSIRACGGRMSQNFSIDGRHQLAGDLKPKAKADQFRVT